jgi:hypothetical protein
MLNMRLGIVFALLCLLIGLNGSLVASKTPAVKVIVVNTVFF